MIFVDNENINDPHVNLAMEEYLIRNINLEDDLFLFYINEHSIIIGRNQNTLEEINRDYVEANNIHVVRRLSGGGAVYHDLGNLNFSFITRNEPGNFNNFRKFTAPVVETLHEIGVPAELSGRNDILVDGRKVSGNAQYISSNRMVSHGTLLLNTDLSQVSEALNVKVSKIESKGIKSVRSRVANISEFLAEPMDIFTFRNRILESAFKDAEKVDQYHLTAEDWAAIHTLADERYRSWEWNYGRSPDFNIQKTQRFASGEIDARIDVHRGLITNIKFFGDFFGQGEASEFEKLLIGARYDRAYLEEKLTGIDISFYFGGLTTGDFLTFLV